MIRFALHELLLIYVVVSVVGIFIAWWMHSVVRSNRERRALKNVVRCGFCSHEFRDETETPLPRCPSCGGLVERKVLSRL
jgi:DNA-directed RNA polymerase subunit RPC12/RpoP